MGIGSGIFRCAPPNLLVLFMPECRPPLKNWNWLEFFLISIPNVICWKAIIQAAILASTHILVACICQATLLKVCFRSSKSTFSSTLMYRTLGVLNNLFNESYKLVTSCLIFAATFTPNPLLSLLFSLFRTLGLDRELGNPFRIEMVILIVCLAWLFLTALLVLVYVIGNVGSLYEVSSYELKRTKSITLVSNENRVLKWQKLVHKSWQPVKVACGVSNFVERITPFKLLNFTFLLLVDLVLGNKKQT